MFLITTPIEESWRKEEKIIFLGEWCKLYNRKNVWYNLKYQTLPYHWDNRNKFQKDNILFESIYEKYLLIIANELNRIHNTDHSLKYWRIVIGLWLRYFIEVIFDRYNSIDSAKNNYKINKTWILKYDLYEWIPLNYQEFHKQSILDSWNHVVYSEIIKFFNDIPYEIRSDKLNYKPSNTKVSFLKIIFKEIIIYINKIIPLSFKNIFFVNAIIPLKDILLLQIKLKQFPNLFQTLVSPVKTKRKSINKNIRKLINLDKGTTNFEKLIDSLIPKFFPLSYLESYKQLEKDMKKVYPKKVDKIYTANAYSYDEAFKVWVASQVGKGAKLIIGQHGGRTGTVKIHQADKHQIKISDNYISWGWKGKDNKIIPLPSIKLSNLRFNPKDDGRITVVLPSYQRYFYHSSSMPLAGQYVKHFEEQLLVLDYLKSDIKNNYFFRVGPRSGEFNTKYRLHEKNIYRIDRIKYFKDSVNNSRLVIHTDNSTCLLETMAANFPSLIFWNPKYYELSDEAKPFFDTFYEMGIMHYDPKSLANKLKDIYKDTNSWWNQSEIQDVRKEFCNNFALTSNDWLESWQKCFTLLIKS